MAVDRLFDADGDLVWENGGPIEVSGLEELKQALMSIIQTPLGRFLDEDVGMSYEWLIGGYDEIAAKAAVETALMQDKRVISVTDVEANQSNGTVVFHIICETTLGNCDFETEVNLDAINR